MDKTPEQIMNHIELQRDKFGRNLSELESRVKRSTDWRAQFDRNGLFGRNILTLVIRWSGRNGCNLRMRRL